MEMLSATNTEMNYEDICLKVWDQYTRLKSVPTPSGETRQCLLPPPPRNKRVEVLVVGMSPNNNPAIRYEQTLPLAKRFAAEFEYVSKEEKRDTQLSYNYYYRALLDLVRGGDKKFGVWWQVEAGTCERLVEFTDALHTATEPGGEDLAQLTDNLAPHDFLREECLEILKMEIALYQPRAVLCNGRFPSDLLFKLCSGYRMGFNPPVATVLKNTNLGCNVHFMNFYRQKSVDGFTRLRIAQEIRRELKSLI